MILRISGRPFDLGFGRTNPGGRREREIMMNALYADSVNKLKRAFQNAQYHL